MPPIRQLAPDLWVVDAPFRYAPGVDLGGRTTIVRLADGGTWLHSPVALTDAQAAEIEAIGRPKFIVAPNYVHYLFVADAHRRWPDAAIWAVRRLERKLTVPIAGTLVDGTGPWGEAIAAQTVDGAPALRETAFLHRPSRTLILTDLLCHFDDHSHASMRIAARLGGIYRRASFPHVLRWLMVQDRAAMKTGIDAIAAWDFDRIVVTHGSVVETGGHEAFTAAFRWLPV